MAAYQARSKNALYFELTKDDELIGRLLYKNWFQFDAAIEIADKTSYQIEPKGFWGTTIELKDGAKVLLKFKMNWSGAIVVQTFFSDFEKGYIFKHRGLFKESFVLTDQEGTELLVMKPQLKWSKMNYEYLITTTEAFETLSDKEILLLNSLHCANYYMAMMMTAIAPGA